jgi:hypothetical protein
LDFLSRRKPGKNDLSILVVVLLFGAVFVGVTFQFAHAGAPAVQNTAQSSCVTCGSQTIGLTVNNVGDTIVIGFGYVTNTHDQASIVTSITGGSTTFFKATSDAGVCQFPTCGGAGQTFYFGTELWSGSAGASGAITYTVSWTYSPNTVGLTGYDVTGVPTQATTTDVGHCNESASNCPGLISTNNNNGFPTGQAIEIGAFTSTQQLGAAGNGYTKLATLQPDVAGEYSATATSVNSPTAFPMNTLNPCNSPCGWSVSGAIFANSAVTTTTTANTVCLGGCSGGNNGTSHAPGLTTFSLKFYASQNLQTASQVDNVTIKIKSVNINVVTGTGYIVCYGTTGIPSAGNPYTLITSNPFSLFNGSSNFFVHDNPQAALAANEYYLCGFLIPTTHSNSATITGSGVSVYETSQSGITEYKYNCGCTTPPSNFYSNTVNTPRDWIYIHTIFAVMLLTTTSTSTVTGAVTTTVTTSSTSTILVNQGDPSKPAFWWMPFFFLMFVTSIFIGAYAMLQKAGAVPP